MSAPPPAQPLLALQDVSLHHAGGVLALQGLTLQAAAGEWIALVGPSGCGKSTALRLLAGLLPASGGEVSAPAAAPGAADPATAFVLQEPTLMPWASVFDNVWLPLRLQGRSRAESAAAVRQQLQAVGLAEFERARPAQLSGGMKMRVSIARALVTQPRVLLMDEPFAALDDFTRQKLQGDLLQWWQRLRPATVFVTHNVAEAVYLSQRVLVMSPRPGRVVAEIAVPQAHPRERGFRLSAAFFECCRQVSLALEEAVA
ncbi:MAG: ABC transporter ATP-binding protein [Rubrivivax sp.]|nr:ABC transporter ATP-binding protein [Rubrivivax sp.]